MSINVTEAAALRAASKKSFETFVKEFWSTVVPEPLVWNWHMSVICQEMQAWAERIFRWEDKLYDEVVNICPGSSKSTIASILFHPWAQTRMPSFSTLGASYAGDLALEFGRKSRDVQKSELYRACFPEIVIRPDQDTKTNYMNTRGGTRYSVGSGGTVQGFHFHAIIIDDPIDPGGTLSEADLFTINNWIDMTLGGRKKDKRKTVTFLIMQRLHQNDPTARMVGRPRVRHIKIPASLEFEVKPAELASNYKGGLMDPVRIPQEVLDEAKITFGDYGYAGQFGQDPIPAGGGMFKTDLLMWGTPPARFQRVVRFWDRAATMKGMRAAKRAAFTVGVKMGLDAAGRWWVLDVIREQLDSYRREAKIKKTALKDTRRVWVGQEREGGSGGVDQVTRTLRRLPGFVVRTIPSTQDKAKRADPFSEQVNGGNVWLPARLRQGNEWTGWAREFVDELKHFPFSTHADQVDAASGAFTVLFQNRIRVGPLKKSRRFRNLTTLRG